MTTTTPSPAAPDTEVSLSKRLARNIELAITLRCLHNYTEARRTAEIGGADVSTLPAIDYKETETRYEAIIDEWLGEQPSSPEAGRAFIDLALVIMMDGRLTPLLDCGTIAGDEKDWHHAVRALEAVRDWLGRRETEDYVERVNTEMRDRITAREPKARSLARQGADADLLVAERDLAELHRKYEAKRPLSDAAADELADEKDRIVERINSTAPATIAGALVKLRHFINSGAARGDHGVSDDERTSLQQIAEFLERETQPPSC